MISLKTLGPLEVRVDGHEAPRELLWRKNLALLIYLARSPDRRRTREHLVGVFWGDKPDSSARHSLNEALRVIGNRREKTSCFPSATRSRWRRMRSGSMSRNSKGCFTPATGVKPFP